MNRSYPTKSLPSVNDLIEEYFRSCELTEQCNQLRERLRTDLNQELNKIDARLKMAEQHVLPGNDIHLQKKLGDLILANLTEINIGSRACLKQKICSETAEKS
jgi:predicted ribosome quality control (RQC) complex YloA/Tae2 family protein